ncbi:hypothetical protein Tco_0195699 [Tanacetum coccineum]
MAQENYIEGCSMQRPPLLEADSFFFWKTRFETYIKSKDIDLWQVIQNGDFYFEIEDSKTKMMKETSYELLKDNQKKQLGMNNETKMTLYNALPRKEYERVFMCKTAKEVWHTLIITHKGNSRVNNARLIFSLKNTRSSKSPMKKLLIVASHNLMLLAKMTAIEEAKDLATLPLDELIGNLKVYEMILASDGVASKPIKEKVMPIALKANVTRGQTSNDSVCQDGSDEDEDEEEEFNSIVRNLWKLFKKGKRFERENRFGNSGDKFDRGRGGRSKGVGSSRQERSCYGCGSKNYFIDDCPRAKVKKALVYGAWSDSDNGDQIKKDITCIMAIGS